MTRIFTCDGTQNYVYAPKIINGTSAGEGIIYAPGCANGLGHWIDYTPPAATSPTACTFTGFDTACLKPDDLGAAWSAGFIVVGVGLVIAWIARTVLEAIKG